MMTKRIIQITMTAIIQPARQLEFVHLSVAESQHSSGAQSLSESHDSPTQFGRQTLSSIESFLQQYSDLLQSESL